MVEEVYQKGFDVIDEDDDGLISKDDFALCFKYVGYKISPRLLESFFWELDVDSDGKLTLEDLLSAFYESRLNFSARLNLLMLLVEFIALEDNRGCISLQECVQLLCIRFGRFTTDADIHNVFVEMMKPGSNKNENLVDFKKYVEQAKLSICIMS
eukprot:TRINITY_DN7382_c0_g1_i1.p1 TRINITY_DN7382_c0_g1~~TRINITY_DN7382_c0_g1_i1.p1  ORF type:complete len:155 (+),score=52.85 TRINITY_DN7382_c0_g1_i1:62-526(+)